jgi:predicted metalloprotease
MRFRKDADLDSSQVSDRRGMGGPVAIGGGGIIGVIILVLTLLNSGGSNSVSNIDLGGGGASSDLSGSCRTGDDANQREDCRIVAVINSVQSYWSSHMDGYEKVQTVFFSGGTSTGCGAASTDVGPFYCPVDSTAYIDLGFYDELRSRFGATGGPFAEAYVIAHEYGHHVQHLRGLLERSQDGTTGPTSSSVRIELMADCLAGQWASGAVATGFIEDLTDADIADGLDAAAAVGDDRIQEAVQGRVDPESFTHGTAEQRQRWFLAGFKSSAVEACDTFAAATL